MTGIPAAIARATLALIALTFGTEIAIPDTFAVTAASISW